MRIAVLGAGMVGSAMALDLARDYSVTTFDLSGDRLLQLKQLDATIEVREANLQHYDRYAEWLREFDFVVTAVPGFMGYACLKAVIAAGKNVSDISFFPENCLDLDAYAKEKGVTVITDVGVAPGMSNLILGYYNEQVTIKNFECYVGGLPAHPQPPFYYKAPFSPIDVIEEYTRPARLKEKGLVVTREALTERELMHFEGVGTLEAFNTDGLRSLLYTMPHIPDMKEKTLRYPGHLDLILSLQAAGFFSTNPVTINGLPITPLQFSGALLIDQWKLQPGEEELTVMKVVMEGHRDNKPVTISYHLLDRYDPKTRIASMSRTTGYTCTAALNLMARGLFLEKGVFPPERVGKHEACFHFVLDYLRQRGVNWVKKESGN